MNPKSEHPEGVGSEHSLQHRRGLAPVHRQWTEAVHQGARPMCPHSGARLPWFPPFRCTGSPAPLHLSGHGASTGHPPPHLAALMCSGHPRPGEHPLPGSSLSSQDWALLSPAHHPLRNKPHHSMAEGPWGPGHSTSWSFTQQVKTKHSLWTEPQAGADTATVRAARPKRMWFFQNTRP